MVTVQEMYASRVFDDRVMKARLPKEIYRKLRHTVSDGQPLDLDIANSVAAAMKNWALELGATHYTHWFQPMTGVTAEKHDAFIVPDEDGRVLLDFSGKELIKGEPDASSLPSGGLRATFEARGYTAWDPTSYAFIKDDTLCIPTAFCSYSGDALDEKTPLLRSMDALDRQARRILKLFGKDDVRRVVSTVGPEQEYFLIDKSILAKRPDLRYCGRTLLGARPPKGQEMDDHYFGAIKPRVAAFMKELDEELWKLGVPAKTEHNETAPAQHELAPVFSSANLSTDHNQLTMELMKRVADRHGLVCLLHEKPFEGVNGSGKHNNWSMSTDSGVNLLEPGETPHENAQFLLFLSAVIQAVDEHQDLLRVSIASAGNDHRLGANEAPPYIISIFLGDDLTRLLQSIANNTEFETQSRTLMGIGSEVLPHFPKDTTDRNRTSPFAFTGNRFEFRMPGSTLSIAGPNTMLNTIVADVLSQYADTLENSSDFTADLNKLIRNSIRSHMRIIFNGNNYSREWAGEAWHRGLLNLPNTPSALPCLVRQANVDLFERHHVFTATELASRYDMMLENYCKTIHIEALTLSEMIRRDVLPAVLDFQAKLASAAVDKEHLHIPAETERMLLEELSVPATGIYGQIALLDDEIMQAQSLSDHQEMADYYCNRIIPRMNNIRSLTDKAETRMPSTLWPYPSYGEMLYSVR